MLVMARLARIVATGYPHHVTQRGNRRQQTFFCDEDYLAYIQLMADWSSRCGNTIWAYCLMPNHVHLIVVPDDEKGFALGIGEAHRRYTRRINFRENWRGYLWQGRFSSCVLDAEHLYAAVRYVEMNPVGARLVERPDDWPWSSAKAHLSGIDDSLVQVAPMKELIATYGIDWRTYLDQQSPEEPLASLRQSERTGRPLGDSKFLDSLSARLGRNLKPRKPGRPRKTLQDKKI